MPYITFYNPYHSANRDEVSNAAFNRFVNRFNAEDCSCGQVPSANITENDNEFHIAMALPGVDKKNISIRHEKDMLYVNVDKKEETKKEETQSKESYYRQEFDYSGSSRVFKTGGKVDSDRIHASYENGVLKIILPKKEAFVKRPAQTIEVR